MFAGGRHPPPLLSTLGGGAAPADSSPQAPPVPEGHVESGRALKDGGTSLPPGSGEEREGPDDAEGPWMTQQKKRRSKKMKKNQNTAGGQEPLSLSGPCSLKSLVSLDPAPPQSQAQQGGPSSQPPGTGRMPLEDGRPLGHPPAGPLRGQVSGGVETAMEVEPGSSPAAPSHPTEPGSILAPPGHPTELGSSLAPPSHPTEPESSPAPTGHPTVLGSSSAPPSHPTEPGSNPVPPSHPTEPGSSPAPPGHAVELGNNPVPPGHATEPGSSPAPLGQIPGGALQEGKAQAPPDHSEGKGLSRKGVATDASAGEARPGGRGASQDLPLPEPKGGNSAPRKEPQTAGQQAGSPGPGPVVAAPAGPVTEAVKGGKSKTQTTKQPPASGPASQETKCKDKGAVPGEKAGGREKPKPEAPKRPEGSPVTHPAAAKKEQGNQRAATQDAEKSMLSPEQGVTVYFHAIISKHFNFDPHRHEVVVRGAEQLGKAAWRGNVCTMYSTRDLGDSGFLLEGSAVIPRRCLDKPLPYKYVVVYERGPHEYEFIYKAQEKQGEHVNRCLWLKPHLLHEEGWHQYDDIICKRAAAGTFQKFMDFMTDGTRKDLVKGKKFAAVVMLDQIFQTLRPWNAVTIKSFFARFWQFYDKAREPMVYEGRAQTWHALKYGEQEVKTHLWEYLKEKMAPFLSENRGALPEDFPVTSPLRMGLIVLCLLDMVHIPLADGHLSMLCQLLSPGAMAPSTLHDDLATLLGTPYRWRELLVHLCQHCMARQVDLWVCVLPVLHLCAQPPPWGTATSLPPEDTWAALEGLPFAEFREDRYEMKLLLQLMEERRHLLGVDSVLFQSWFSLMPLHDLVPYMEEATEHLSRFPARVLDCLLGTHYRLCGLRGATLLNHETIEKILRMLLHLLDIYGGQVLEAPLGQSHLTLCQKFHKTVCSITREYKSFELPALSAELMCRIASLEPRAGPAAGRGEETREENSGEAIFRETLEATRAWLRKVFVRRMCNVSYSLSAWFSCEEEIKVWRRLVEMNVPAELGWKEALLRDMEGRIKQEPPHVQITMFCHVHRATTRSGDSVSKCFEKCALEAVGMVCQSQASVLEGLSDSDLRHFGTLVSAVVSQAWPRRRGAAVDDEEEVLEHLLTGPDIKHIFKLCGSDEKVLAGITEESRRLLDVADSVFTRVASDLHSGAVRVGQLELILRRRGQFLDIWKIKRSSLPPQRGQCEMTDVLAGRSRELSFLRTEQSYVDSLLKTCGKVQDVLEVDFGDIENRHLEDLASQRLSDVMAVGAPAASSEPQGTRLYSLSPQLREMARTMHLLRDSLVFQAFWREEAVAHGSPGDVSTRPVVLLEEVQENVFSPCFRSFMEVYENVESGEVTFEDIDNIFKDFVDRYNDLTHELQLMCRLSAGDPGDWIPERVQQIQEYHRLHLAAESARAILTVKENLGLTGDFSVLQMLLNFTDNFKEFCHEKLGGISRQLIKARKLLQDISGARLEFLEELARRREFICWAQKALRGITELKVFVDLASISAGENDMDVDRVACFHDAVQGCASLLYDLPITAGFHEFMECLGELWKALENDQHLPSKLRDSARNLEWLQTVRESHGSVELSSLSLATTINSKGVYVIQAPPRGQKISPDAVLHLLLPESHRDPGQERRYSLEELKELLNKLMLMSGKRERSATEVEAFSEVFCGVQNLVQAFIDLYSAGNMLFRSWAARVICAPQEGSVIMDFHLGPVKQLEGRGPLAGLLMDVCRELEAFLAHWQGSVAQARAEHVYLNYYTAEQLVYLSVELGEGVPSKAALTMLSFLKGGCTPRDVADACRGAKSQASRQQRRELGELQALVTSEPSLAGRLRVFLEQSMQCMGTFLPAYLDLDSLGRCLARLAEAAGPPVERQLPKGLQGGQPNLVVCPQAEVLPATLAIYMQSPEQPLPSYDEVLLCGPGTTFEEVALLLRRCLAPGACGRRLYSLLFADRLSYEVGCQAEELLRHLSSRPHREDYQLVLVCDSEREHCGLPSAFSQHKVLVTPQQPLEAVQAYLLLHLQAPTQAPAAGAVFQDQACVGIVASERAGVGKSLYVRRLHDKLKRRLNKVDVPLKVIRLTDPQVDEQQVLDALLPFLDARYQGHPMIVHLDVTSTVRTGVPEFLFKLLVLRHLMDANGKMWLRNPRHLYIVEILEGASAVPERAARQSARVPQFGILEIFPKVTCRPPKEVISLELSPTQRLRDPGMDEQEFCSETFQRPYQYLKRFYQKQDLDSFQYKDGSVEDTPGECLQLLLIYCGVLDPSWLEMRNFAGFLNYQLRDCEASLFCQASATGDVLSGFKTFVVTFMICMARDFATPTLHMSDQSPGQPTVSMRGVREEDLAPFSLRKRWESEPHPYVFFNDDHTTMTFIGFHLQPNQQGGVDAVDPAHGEVIKRNVMTSRLCRDLQWQRVPFNINFDELPRHEKLERLCLALGVQWPFDPDDTYELTTDNMLKILAIEMRFRCGIPVVIMGETGCGKTRLVRFLSELRRGSADAQTLLLVKVHGGTTADMIYAKVREAQELALFNRDQHQLDTILFLDEANTTEAISCIKEVLCDRTVDGQPLVEDSGLHIVAACNPYRKHSQEMICRLEAAGLGYRVRAEETADRLGTIPLRQLVYRVHALPPSLVPLVWDFGQLDAAVEKRYIQQIVQRLVGPLGLAADRVHVVAEVLAASQAFMRASEGECSFVSLRDVERCTRVFRWFYDHSPMLLGQLRAFLGVADAHQPERDPALWSLVLAIGVCYHAPLEDKEQYRAAVCGFFPAPFNDAKAILEEITLVQDLFLAGVSLRKAIARNSALKENVFMMVICIELKIPLFVVGKPGSSKSLAKTIVADAMQGQAAHSELFRHLKQVHLVSFQCSPHSTPQGIIGTFRQCARFQQAKDLQQYVSVVVLDEVGLAEDSPKMPLKTLHPLLEDGCIEDAPAPHKKVGFVGISNWALDPAKMNRGIFVSRSTPNQRELVESASGICSSEPLVQKRVQGYFAPFARAYEDVLRCQSKEFFGLRDFYSLIKMVFATARVSSREPSPRDITGAILRNFSGKDDVHALDIFAAHLPEARCLGEVSTMQLIEQNLLGNRSALPDGELDGAESRYLLVLTRNYVALQILQQTLFSKGQQPEIIFGSSFPRDQEYTQVCRDINRVKVCMETGRMAVLLNLQSLYESLYDALNQYYVYLGGQKYVDLGLGTHRVKCRVHPDFRLVVIEDKDVVYRHFPVPLINRLEKHYLDIDTVLEAPQRAVAEELRRWVERFVAVEPGPFQARPTYSPADVFVGFHADACASVVLQVAERLGRGPPVDDLFSTVLEEAKLALLDCATPDAMVRLRGCALDSFTAQALARTYYKEQQHDSFADFLGAHVGAADWGQHAVFTEVTTFSRLLTNQDCETLEAEVKGRALRPMILFLQKFDTEVSFLKKVRSCLTGAAGSKILIIQTDFEDSPRSAQLVASAKYSTINEVNKLPRSQDCVFVYFIAKLPRLGSGSGYVGFHGGLWRAVHIDDLRRSPVMDSDVTRLQNVAISQLFRPDETHTPETGPGAGGVEEPMEVEAEHPEAEQGGCHAQVLDTTSLLRSCIQGAVGLLRDQREGAWRSVRRVELLLGLLNEDSPAAAAFLRVVKMRLCDLLRRQEEQHLRQMQEWVVRAAWNQDALQEAGTFRHTLWRRIQATVTPLLASLVATVDRDDNLELLARPGSPRWVGQLWMLVFSDTKLLDIPLVTGATRPGGEASPVVVQSFMSRPQHVSCDVPFSWRIRDYLEELSMQAQYTTGPEGLPRKLVEIFQQTPLGGFLAQLPEQERQELLESYLKDFLLLTMRVSTWEELQFLHMALWSCIRELWAERPEEDLSLPWVHLAYQHFRSRLHNFLRILTVHPQVLGRLQEGVRKHPLTEREMALDAFAALACAEMLTTDLLKPSPQAWLQAVKSLSVPLELLCSDAHTGSAGPLTHKVIQEVRVQWNRVFSISLFVEHVLLGTLNQIPELGQLVTRHVSLLSKCLQEDSDVKTHRPFLAVMNVLRGCKDEASRALSRCGVRPCPVCLGDTQDPVRLPCDHVFCLRCIQGWLTPGQMMCPLCRTDLPDGFSPRASKEHRVAVQKHARFRQLCDGFFLDLVSAVCFKDSAPPQSSVVRELLALLFARKELVKDTPQRHREHTKCLSPFDDVVDKSPVIRSVVLKLLLQYSFHEVREYIQDYLSMLEEKAFVMEDKTDLYMLFCNCLEDSLHEKASALSPGDRRAFLREETHFLTTYVPARDGPTATVDHLQEVARIRLCLDRAADCLAELQDGSALAEEQRHYLRQVERFCARADNGWFQVYLVRKLSSQGGMEFAQRLSREGSPAQWVFPREVLAQQRDHPSQMDRYLVYGEEYKTLREAVGQTILKCKPAEVALEALGGAEPQRAVHLLLALFREVSTLYRSPNASLHPKPEQCEAVNKLIDEGPSLPSPDVRQFAKSLVTNSLPLLGMDLGRGGLEGTMSELAVHTAAVLLCGQSAVLQPLRSLAFSPASMERSFLPTMPEDLMAQARTWKGLEGVRWYTCPNGHPCSVGECGMPMEHSVCVDCGAPVGGEQHKPVAGFHVITNEADRTQTGHVLGRPPARGEAVACDRGLSPVALVLLQLLTHLAMLLGAAQWPQALRNIIKPRVSDPASFLQLHIQRNLEQLTTMLAKSADEAASVVHLVLRRLLSDQSPFHSDPQLLTKEVRNEWEKLVEKLLLPELKQLDHSLLTVHTRISQDERISSNPVAKIIFGDPASFLPRLPRHGPLHCSRAWGCRRRLTLEHLRHVVEQRRGRDSVPVLWRFLQKEAELRLVKFLPEILALQRSLVKRFQNVPEVEYNSLRGFINSQHSEGLRQQYLGRINTFLATWNRLRRSLETHGEIKLPKEYCSADLDLDSAFEVVLPRRQGLGLCSTALASYLMSLHNEMVYAVEKFSPENGSYSVDAPDITDLHVISYEVERDLAPLIFSNCQYQVAQDGETEQDFDLEKIQRQVTSRFLQGKPRLTLKGIPTLVYRRDWNYEHLFADIRSKVEQEPLPRAVASALGGQLQSYSDACEALSALEVALKFLSTGSGDANMALNTYVQDMLRMEDQTVLVLTALSKCQLRHAVALWQFLSAHKSEQQLRLRKEPFADISDAYKDELSPEDTKRLRAFLNQTDLDAFLLELHELMVLKLKGPRAPADFNPKWSLRDTLLSYLDTKECEAPPGVESQFPEELPLSSCVCVWKTAAELKRDWQMR
ncbi:E3 ubiquitin-protein ligase RNF213 isoform X2 [Talpa occidentalis]|uniref:E3 ubiquitin-protein ligase RNF213 isoform X2 n=1 Tax=Talpa occidentalis TaxID=50954 RepID=UPI0023F9B599|nr:E3 ubiquitin-protein ligase RNF213 isoform X2 [Talpa occidentalis]